MNAARVVIAASLVAVVACESSSRGVTNTNAAAPTSAPTPTPAPACDIEPLAARFPAPKRLVAIADVHGDMKATREALELAGAIDGDARWIGGDLVVVQTGDILDRGDDEQAILDMLERLADEAKAVGGALHVLNGNHEIMNAAGDFRYVTEGGYADFEDVPNLDTGAVQALPANHRARAAAFAPGGPYARLLAGHNTAIVVGRSAFAHGGIVPEYARYGLAKLNGEIRCWLAGQSKPPALMSGDDNPMWSRHFSVDPPDCEKLEEALRVLDVDRMVVGHTPQEGGVTSACDGKVWRIDVGMARAYGGTVQVLEIRGDRVRVLKAK